MSTSAAVSAVEWHAGYSKGRLFFVSSLALTTAGVAASLRANAASDLQRIFLDPLDKAHSAAMIGGILGITFLGFALTIAIGSALFDAIGIRLLLPLAGLCLAPQTLLMVFADRLASGMGVYNTLWVGALIAGVGWGLVETVINPLIATLDPDEKTAKLNRLHAWWPGGMAIGGRLGLALTWLGLRWQGKLALVAVPAAALIVLCDGVRFLPQSALLQGCR